MDGFSLSHPVPIILRAKWDQATRRVFPSFLFSRLYDSLNRRVISFSYLFSFPLTCHFFSFIIIDWWHGERWDRETGSGESRTKERDEWVREANGGMEKGHDGGSYISFLSRRPFSLFLFLFLCWVSFGRHIPFLATNRQRPNLMPLFLAHQFP